MKKTTQMITVLTVVGLLAGLTLALVYKHTDPLIVKNRQNEMKKAIFEIFQDAKSYDDISSGDDDIFRVKDKNGKLLGYAFVATGNGYQGQIQMMAGIQPDLVTLAGMEVLDSQETPGLGQEITTDKFENQFKGLKTAPEITYIKNAAPTEPNQIEAITGATVSSSAVVGILNYEIKRIKPKLK